jgi:acyl-CoA synthetase (AMP-forming)/AMP-acid ligase II/3-hydroxymyristoyl/3-hydroxydecanoyl-(acyl carrier protein) dehydratase
VTSLCVLFTERRSNDAVLSLRGETWLDFTHDVGRLSARLRDATDEAAATGWVLLADDAYVFAVGIFGLWHAGRHAVLPPNRGGRTFLELCSRTAGVLTDDADWLDRAGGIHPLENRPGARTAPLGSLSPEALAVDLYTSGTTGDNRPVRKRIRHLDDEISELSRLWRDVAQNVALFSTASPQHLYGLLFGVLWPLASGMPFHPEQVRHPGEIVPRMLEAEQTILISVPSTLKQLARHEATDRLRGRCRAIFSSGGPLGAETAIGLAKRLGDSPFEVFGSTETGGVAWRQQAPGEPNTPWTPFPSVTIRQDRESGRLRVHSPFVSVDEENDRGFSMGDRVSLAEDGRFLLEGRIDQIVKIAEKRLDLAQMSAELRRHESVEEVALAAIERDGQSRVAAAVVLSPHGRALLERDGRLGFNRRLREHLRAGFDPVVHPRYWRVVSELPSNAQGKVPLESIRALFEAPEPRDAVTDRPELLNELRGSDFIERTCRVPEDLSCFAGHFPDVPVVPGVLQLDWAMECVRALLSREPRIAEIESLKLIAPLRPGREFKIHTRITSENNVLLEITSTEAIHAKGRVRLAAND